MHIKKGDLIKVWTNSFVLVGRAENPEFIVKEEYIKDQQESWIGKNWVGTEMLSRFAKNGTVEALKVNHLYTKLGKILYK